MPDGPPGPTVTLESFVPEFVLHQLTARGSGPLEPTEELVEAATMFIDVVGFTAMTEAASAGKTAGAEQVSARLRAAFGDLDQLVHASGGTIVDFVGDGLLAIWLAINHGSVRGAARAAIGCGNAIQLRVGGDRGPDRLKFRVAVGAGHAWLVSTGGHNGSWIPIAGGDAIEQLGPTLSDAWPGEVTLSAETTELLDLDDRLAPREILLREPASGLASSDDEPAVDTADPELVVPFVPDIVRARFEAGLLESFAEYRRVTAGFVRLPRVDPADADRVEQMQELTTRFQEAVDDFGGSVVNVLVDDRGTVGIAMWGAALHAHDDDAMRAIQSVKALQKRLGGDALEVPAAVASGLAFFGDIGSRRRRQHAVVGTAVNRAARLMEQSDGPILCDDETVRLVRRRMAFEERSARELKGLPGKTRIFTPVAELEPELPGRRPLIGRTDQVAQLAFELESVTSGDAQARLLTIEGEAGIGKSRLVGHLLEESQRFAIRGMVIRGSQLASSVPYQAWKPVLLDLLGGDANASTSLAKLLPNSPHRRQLVEKILGLQSGADERAVSNPDAARDVLTAVFSQLLERTPTLLVVEDAHWLDLPSWELLGSLLNIPRTLIVVTLRPDAEAQLAHQVYLAKAANSTVIQLGPLTEAETAALVCQRLDVSSLPEELAKAIVSRTEGHPLFTEELTLAVRDEGIIKVDAAGHVTGDVDALASLTYPATVHSTVASRIDQLPLPEQLSLRVASVVGRDFDVAAVTAGHSSGLTDDEVREQLGDIERHQLIERTAGDGEFTFKHAIIADVAYGTLPETDRILIHNRVAAWLEGRLGEEPAALDPVVAQHWIRAGNAERAQTSLERSAEYAMGIYSYREAIGFLHEAQELAEETASPTQGARWAMLLGEAYRGLGDLPASQRALEEAAALLGSPMPGRRRLGLAVAWQAVRQVAHRVAPRLFISRRTNRHDRIERIARIYWAMTFTTFGSQDGLALFYVGLRAANEAERIPPSGVLALGYSFLTFGVGIAGMAGLADRYYQRGLAAADAAADEQAAADVRFNRGVFLTAIGDFDEAGSATRQAIDDFRRMDMHYDYLNASGMRSYVLLHEGHWDEAANWWRKLAEEAEDLEEALYIVWSRVWGASVALRQGELAAAGRELSDAAGLTDRVGEVPSQIARLGYLALSEWWGGHYAEALLNARESLDLMKRTEWLTAPHAYDGFAVTTRVWLSAWERSLAGEGHEPAQAMQRSARRACQSMSRLGRSVAMARPGVHRAWGSYHALAGKQRKAMRRWQKGLAEAERLGMPYEEALLLGAMVRHGDLVDLDRDSYRRRAKAIFEGLGAAPELARLGGG